jgi:hypothetical protein
MLAAILVFSEAGVFAMGRVQKVPMKTLDHIDITDGEYLHYGYYSGGEKSSDTYFVTKKETGSNGNLLLRVYSITEDVSGGKKIPDKYTDWPTFYLIDPVRGSTIESRFQNQYSSSTDNDTNSLKNDPYKGLISSHYQLFQDPGYVEYISKVRKGKEITENRCRINLKGNFPTFDANSFFFLPVRVMDIAGGGIMYLVAPELLKEPLPFFFKSEAEESVKVKAGIFDSHRLVVMAGDPFLGAVGEPILKKAAFWVDKKKRITVKIQFAFGFGTMELEEISNVSTSTK